MIPTFEWVRLGYHLDGRRHPVESDTDEHRCHARLARPAVTVGRRLGGSSPDCNSSAVKSSPCLAILGTVEAQVDPR